MDNKTNIDIWVATHRKLDYSFPELYKPMQVNCKVSGEHWDKYLHDDEGENISEKNYCYCELTVLYSLWKNSKADIKGLCHYRRLITGEEYGCKVSWYGKFINKDKVYHSAINRERIISILQHNDLILPIPDGPFPYPIKEERLRYCYQNDLDALRETIETDFPQYLESYNWVMNQRFLVCCNMFIAKRELFDDYCEWVFALLEKVENKCCIENYDAQHKRIFGYLSELLLTVYVNKHHLKCKYFYKAFVSEFWETKGLKQTLKSRIIKKIGGIQLSKQNIWLLKLLRKRHYLDYLELNKYLFEVASESAKG